MEWETVIGLECHVQLKTESKLFSCAPNRYGDGPNQNADVVDLGLPGVLPVLNKRAVELAVRLGVALECEVQLTSEFARKHYFYPDLPKGYQTTQFEHPICLGGRVPAGEREIPLTRIHMEEDAGKSVHAGANSSLDYNRAGTPLLEVVSEPAMHSPEEAMAFVRELRAICIATDVSDGNMQEGSLRADVNVSVRRPGEPLGQRTETKNLNSVRFLGDAIRAEVARQIQVLSRGGRIDQETRLWDPDKGVSRVMRSKEDAQDYRYFPCPDLLPLVVSEDEIARAKAALPELPRARRARLVALGLSSDDARLITEEPTRADAFDDALKVHDNAKGIANWVVNELPGDSQMPLTEIAHLVKLIDDKVISSKIAKEVFALLLAGERDPAAIVEARGLKVESNDDALIPLVEEVIAANPKQVEQYRAGKTKLLGFFVGQLMKKTKGKADPAALNALLKERLDA